MNSRGWSEVLTPPEYEAAFNEGVAAFRKDGLRVKSPYLKIGVSQTGKEQTRALAWENGWWSEFVAAQNEVTA